MRKLLFCLLMPLMIYSQDDVSPEEVQQELTEAEAQYKRAKEMFNPWYTGPLVTPSATMMPPGSANIQPYLFVTGTYAAFNEDRKSIPLLHNSYQVNVVTPMQMGITDTMDLVFSPGAQMNWERSQHGGGFNDIGVTLGFPILRQTLYLPGIKFTVSETFPTGKFKNLSTNGLGLNATGGGSFQTTFAITTAKVIWWSYPYPMNTRLFIGYKIPTMVNVTNFNTYGGGFGTHGRVRPGNILTTDLGLELSFTQRWVFAIDIVYTTQNRTKFHGTNGVNADGTPASVGSRSNDNLSLAPAIEYNWNENFGVLGGAQFSVYGRNSSNFVTGQFSVAYTW